MVEMKGRDIRGLGALCRLVGYCYQTLKIKIAEGTYRMPHPPSLGRSVPHGPGRGKQRELGLSQ